MAEPGPAGGARPASGPAPFTDSRPDDAPWPALRWPVPVGTVLQGDHVRLEPLDPDRDAPALHAALDHDAVWQHVAGRPRDAAALARTLRHRRDVTGWFQWLVRDAAGTRVLGTTSFLEVQVDDARLEVGATAYDPAVWGGPVNPECKLLLLSLAFDTLGAGRVQLKTDVRNTRSQRAIARLGARPEGLLRRYQRRADGTVRDTALFAVVAEDWPAVRAGLLSRLA